MNVILAYGKQGTEVWASALALLKRRLDEGYWYDDEDASLRLKADPAEPVTEAEVARRIVGRENESAAWRFLQRRSDHEYEGVERVRVLS